MYVVLQKNSEACYEVAEGLAGVTAKANDLLITWGGDAVPTKKFLKTIIEIW